jgi:hypothetical protein
MGPADRGSRAGRERTARRHRQQILIHKRGNANYRDTVNVAVKDKIEITWSYPVVPASVPKIVDARMDSEDLAILEIHTIVNPKASGAGKVGAFFEAKAPGKSTIDS